MSSEEKRLFGCPACGFRVTGSEGNCPRCGAKFGGRARFECPFCGETVSPGDERCPYCLVKFNEFVSKTEERVSDRSIDGLLMEIIESEAKQVKGEGKKLSCPTCSWMVDGSEDSCPKCGIRFSEMVAYQCPVCAALVSAETVECEECGSVFLEPPDDEQDAFEEEAEPSVQATREQIEPETAVVSEATKGEPQERAQVSHQPEEGRTAEAAKEEPRVVMRPKLVRRKDVEKAPSPGEADRQPPRKKVRRLKAKPKV